MDAEAKTYRFVDPSRRQELQIAHELALPSDQGGAKSSAAGGGGGAKKRARDVYEAEGLANECQHQQTVPAVISAYGE